MHHSPPAGECLKASFALNGLNNLRFTFGVVLLGPTPLFHRSKEVPAVEINVSRVWTHGNGLVKVLHCRVTISEHHLVANTKQA